MSENLLYPYVITPKLVPAIWGGDALVKTYAKAGDPSAKLGESWECWDENMLANGPLAGKSVGLGFVEKVGQFWKAVSGDVPVEGKRDIRP